MKRGLSELIKNAEDPPKRVRQIEHVEGNWPSFIYILVASEENEGTILQVIKEMNDLLNLDDIQQIQPLTKETQGFNKYHISLSKLFFLRHFQIDSFVKAIRQTVKMKPFSVSLSGSQLFTNEDKSRSFCSILVQKGFNQVIQLIKQIDTVLEKYKKDVYYSPAVPHCTVGSCVGDHSELARKESICGNDYVEVDEYDSDDENMIELSVESIHVSIGNQDFEIPLKCNVC